MRRISRVLGLLALALGIAACSHLQSKEAAYLDSAKGQATQANVRQELGAPKAVRKGEAGEGIWVYEFREQQSGNLYTPPGTWCEEYLLTFDNNAVLQTWKHVSHFHSGGLMPKECIPGIDAPKQ
jgi:hypothetical protein